MPIDWNPNAPLIVGCEQNGLVLPSAGSPPINDGDITPVNGFSSHALDANSSLVIPVASTVTEDIELIGWAFQATYNGHYIAEVYEAGDEVAQNLGSAEYVPGAMGAGFSGSGVVGDIDETAAGVNTSNYVQIDNNGGYIFLTSFGSSGFATTRRVLGVAINITARGVTAGTPLGLEVSWRPGLSDPGPTLATLNQSPGSATTYSIPVGDINPLTGDPWSVFDIVQSLGTSIGPYIRHTNGSPVRIYQVSVVVEFCDENRVGVGAGPVYDSVMGPRNVAYMLRPGNLGSSYDWIADWQKQAATDYTIVLRRARLTAPYGGTTGTAGGTLVHGFAVGDVACTTLPGVATIAPAPSAAGPGAYVPTGIGSISSVNPASPLPSGASLGMWMQTAPTVGSVDSPEYYAVTMRPVFDGNSLQQDITSPVSQEFLFLRAILYMFDGDEPLDDLTINVRRRSDDALFGTGTVTPGDMLDAPRLGGASEWRSVVVALSSTAPLVASTQYYVEFVCTGTTDERPWVVQAIRGDEGDGTFGGTTDALRYPPQVIDPIQEWADVPVTLIVSPDAPTGVAAVGGAEVVDADGVACAVGCVPYADVSWTATALGGDFLLYEIERRDDRDEWETVATVTDEAVETWRDYEVRAGSGIETEYRLRVFRTDLVGSEWSTVAAVVVDPCGPGYVFSSNAAPGVVYGYPDTYDGSLSERTYERPGQTVVREVYGRDGVVGFRPTERRFDEFTRRLLTAAKVAPDGGPGPRGFDGFRSLVESPTLPYVCVRDESGNRFLALVAVLATGVVRLSGEPYHMCEVGVVEASRVPYPAEVSS